MSEQDANHEMTPEDAASTFEDQQAGAAGDPQGAAEQSTGAGQVPDDASELDGLDATAVAASPEVRVAELEQLVAERTGDLQRLQAEYVNYKKRVDRDRDLARQVGIEKVVMDLLPVLDSIAMADQHGELSGGFKLVADEVGKVAGKYGLEVFGAVRDPFDPHLHEALMQVPLPGATEHCISQVMQQGYRIGERIIRPARVAVSDPDPTIQDQN